MQLQPSGPIKKQRSLDLHHLHRQSSAISPSPSPSPKSAPVITRKRIITNAAKEAERIRRTRPMCFARRNGSFRNVSPAMVSFSSSSSFSPRSGRFCDARFEEHHQPLPRPSTSAATTNGDHRPRVPPPRPPPSSSSSASFKGYRYCLFLLFSFLALLVLAVVLVFILAVKPKKPQFDLQQVGVQYMGINSPKGLRRKQES